MNTAGRAVLIAFAMATAWASEEVRADDERPTIVRDCGENYTYCSSCAQCSFDPENAIAQPTCVYWVPGSGREGLILGYFDGCNEPIECDEVIPCYNPPEEENTLEDVALLARALGGTSAEAQAYISRYRGRIVSSMDGSAVQILGCGEAVRAHLPLNNAKVAQTRFPRARVAATFVVSLLVRSPMHAILAVSNARKLAV